MYEKSYQSSECTHCRNRIEITIRWTPGGVNDYGGWVIKCANCQELFSIDIGRDVNDSSLTKGGEIVDRYDTEIAGSREAVLKKHGLA